MAVVLKCPACREKFKYDISEGWPDACPICKVDINNRVPDNVVVMPAFLRQKSKNNDAVARGIMDGSEKRAELAAATAGVPVSEMAGLKITDLNDRNDAEYSAKDEVNDVTRHMDFIKSRGGQVGFGSTQGAEFAAQAHAPVMIDGQLKTIEPYAGARARNRVQAAMPPIGQAPLPKEISDNPNYRSRV